jgi:hypothetical protein
MEFVIDGQKVDATRLQGSTVSLNVTLAGRLNNSAPGCPARAREPDARTPPRSELTGPWRA